MSRPIDNVRLHLSGLGRLADLRNGRFQRNLANRRVLSKCAAGVHCSEVEGVHFRAALGDERERSCSPVQASLWCSAQADDSKAQEALLSYRSARPNSVPCCDSNSERIVVSINNALASVAVRDLRHEKPIGRPADTLAVKDLDEQIVALGSTMAH